MADMTHDQIEKLALEAGVIWNTPEYPGITWWTNGDHITALERFAKLILEGNRCLSKT